MKAKRINTELASVAIVLTGMILGAVCSYYNHSAAAVLIIFTALIGYIIVWVSTQNLFNFLGLAYLGFVFPLGLANFRLSSYQNDWEIVTWVCYIGAVACYAAGYLLSFRIQKIAAVRDKMDSLVPKESLEKGMFPFAIFVFLLLLSAFLIKWWVAGSLPFFHSGWGGDTYIRFMSGEGYLDALGEKMASMPVLFSLIRIYHRISTIFMFQGWMISCLLYGFMQTGRAKSWHKVVSWLVIAVCTVVPILIVIREIYLMHMIAFAVYLYVANTNKKKKYFLVVLMAVLTVVGYAYSSSHRGYNNEQLTEIFEMPVDPKPGDSKDPKPGDSKDPEPGASKDPEPGDSKDPVDTENPAAETTYPGLVIWVYTYLTCGYDNFNYLTKSLDIQTYGLMELRPIFSALQIEGLKDIDMVIQAPKYRVSPNVTTYTFINEAYMDFRLPGVLTAMFVWGLVFGMIAVFASSKNSVLMPIVYAGIGHHIIFMFFVAWMGHFSYLCSFGLLLLYYLWILLREKRHGRSTRNLHCDGVPEI